MFDRSSRYYALETAVFTDRDGRVAAYKRRRFCPAGSSLALLGTVTVTDGDRIDLICARALGDPEHFWRIADANDVLDPAELTATPGQTIRVPIPRPGG